MTNVTVVQLNILLKATPSFTSGHIRDTNRNVDARLLQSNRQYSVSRRCFGPVSCFWRQKFEPKARQSTLYLRSNKWHSHLSPPPQYAQGWTTQHVISFSSFIQGFTSNFAVGWTRIKWLNFCCYNAVKLEFTLELNQFFRYQNGTDEELFWGSPL